jgi:hypothetical protein
MPHTPLNASTVPVSSCFPMTYLSDLPRSRGKICMHGLLDSLIAPEDSHCSSIRDLPGLSCDARFSAQLVDLQRIICRLTLIEDCFLACQIEKSKRSMVEDMDVPDSVQTSIHQKDATATRPRVHGSALKYNVPLQDAVQSTSSRSTSTRCRNNPR